MFVVMQLFTWAKTLLDAMLSALTTLPAAALLTTPKIELFSGPTVPSPTNAFGDFTRAVFTGYAPVALVLSPPINTSSASQGVVANALFSISGAGPYTGDTVTGYIITDGVSKYYGGARFPGPVGLAVLGDFLSLTLTLPLRNNATT